MEVIGSTVCPEITTTFVANHPNIGVVYHIPPPYWGGIGQHNKMYMGESDHRATTEHFYNRIRGNEQVWCQDLL